MSKIVSGYVVYGKFTVRMNYYQSPDEELPDGVIGTDDEFESYKEGDDREVVRTADGKLFLNSQTAKEYAKNLVISELDEVLDLLNKAKLLALANKDKSPVLNTIADALDSVIENPDELMEKYYDSTC